MFGGPWADPAVWAAVVLYGAFVWAAGVCQRVAVRGEDRAAFGAGAVWGVRFATIALAVMLAPEGTKAAFIYFQF
jgi:hypothetical protein